MAAAQHTGRRPASRQLADHCGQVAMPLVRLAHAHELLEEACMGPLLSSCAAAGHEEGLVGQMLGTQLHGG